MRPPHPALAAIQGDVAGVAWPPLSTGTAATLASLLHRLERTQWLPPDRIAELQRHQVAVAASWFADRSPSFAARLAAAGLAAGDLARPGALEELPVLTRAEVQAAGPSLSCEPPPGHGPSSETVTTGSTGTPLTVIRTRVCGLFFAALTIRDYLWRDVDFGGRIAVVRHGPTEPTEHPDWGRPIDVLFPSGASLSMPVSTPIDALADRLAAFGPDVLLSYPTVLGGLVEHLRSAGRTLPTVRLVQTIGETLEPAVRAAAADLFGAPVWDLYSSQELGVLAADCPEGDGMHVAAESVVVEVLDDDGRPVGEGGIGHVVVTDLHNLATPLIRYAQGDLAEVGGPCPCGRGLPVLRRVLGRDRNLLRLPGGQRKWPLFGSHHYREVAPVLQQQIVQTSLDALEVRLRVERPLTPEEEAAVGAIILRSVAHPFELRFTYVDGELPRGPGGKFEEFRCEIAG